MDDPIPADNDYRLPLDFCRSKMGTFQAWFYEKNPNGRT